MKRTRPLLTSIALLISLVTCALGQTAAAADGLDREAYEYKISWNGIPAAYLTMTYTDDEALAWSQMRAKVRTSKFVDLFWSLRGNMWGAIDTAVWEPRGFSFHRDIRQKSESTTITVGEDGSMTGLYQRPGREDKIDIVEGTELTDPVGALLRMRHEIPAPGETTSFDVFTGEARYRIDFTNAGAEQLTLAAGEFAAIKLQPKFWRIGKKDDRVTEMFWWVTAERPHTLLRIRSDVFIGSVYCDLIERKTL